MMPPQKLSIRRVDCRFAIEALEERVVPTAQPAASTVAWAAVSTTQPAVSGGAVAAANLTAVRQAFPNDTGKGYAVAILDTGVDYTSPALGGGFGAGYKVEGGYNFVDTRVPGYVSDDPFPDANPMDENGHGTNVAGILAAKDANFGGVAPDANILALRVLDKNGNGNWDWVDQALQWVIDHRAQYNIVSINMSFGGGNYTGPTTDLPKIQSELQTLWNAGVVNVAAGGNDFFTNKSSQGLEFPAISQYVVSVAAVYDGNYGARSWSSGAVDNVTYTDKIASFTQRSSSLDMLAPGALITSIGLSQNGKTTYSTYAGSSQATPFVAAAALLVHQELDATGQSANATASKIENYLTSTGVPLTDNKPASEDNVTHTGLTFPRLDVGAALRAVDADVATVAHDRYYPNTTQNTAAFLGYLPASATVGNLTLATPGQQSWFSFIEQTGGTYTIQAPLGAGLSSVNLIFYDVTSGRERTITSTLVNGVASVTVDLRDHVLYYVSVQSGNRQVGGYQLTFAASIASVPAAAPNNLPPDRFEPNNDQNRAAFLGYLGDATITTVNLNAPGQVDWFRFQTTIEGVRRIQVVGDSLSGTFEFTFYDVTSGRPRTIASTFVNGVATLDVDLRADVLYFIKVDGLQNQTGWYHIVFGQGGAAPPPTGIPADRFDPNSDKNNAAFLGYLGNATITTINLDAPGQIDWFSFQSTFSGAQKIQVVGDPNLSTFEFTFYDVSTGRSRTILSTFVNGVATINVDLRTDVLYFLKVDSPLSQIGWYHLVFGQGASSGAAVANVSSTIDASATDIPDGFSAGAPDPSLGGWMRDRTISSNIDALNCDHVDALFSDLADNEQHFRI